MGSLFLFAKLLCSEQYIFTKLLTCLVFCRDVLINLFSGEEKRNFAYFIMNFIK